MLSPPAMVGRGAGRDLGSRARVMPQEAESVRVLVVLLSPAAAPSPPVPRERGHPATAEGTRAVCRPAAICKGPSWGWGHGLGTRAGHRWPSPHGQHLPGTGTGIVGVATPALSSEPLPNSLLCTNSCFLFSEFVWLCL